MPVSAVFLHVPLDISPQDLLATIGTCGILLLAQVLYPDVPLAVGLVGESFATGGAAKAPVLESLAEVGCSLQERHCKTGVGGLVVRNLCLLPSTRAHEGWIQCVKFIPY